MSTYASQSHQVQEEEPTDISTKTSEPNRKPKRLRTLAADIRFAQCDIATSKISSPIRHLSFCWATTEPPALSKFVSSLCYFFCDCKLWTIFTDLVHSKVWFSSLIINSNAGNEFQRSYRDHIYRSRYAGVSENAATDQAVTAHIHVPLWTCYTEE